MPNFALSKPNPNPTYITDAEWWLWLEFAKYETRVRLGGIYADKAGFHNTGNANAAKWPGNYSIRDDVNRSGPWWRTKASAIDLTFPDAQAGNYSTIDRYTSRLMASARNSADPRLDKIVFEFYGQDDNDKVVEGYNEYREEAVSSDPSHLWHIHISFLRSACGDFWAMWALLTVLMGWTVKQWQESLSTEEGEDGEMNIDDVYTLLHDGRRAGPSQTAGGGVPIAWIVRKVGEIQAGQAADKLRQEAILAAVQDGADRDAVLSKVEELASQLRAEIEQVPAETLEALGSVESDEEIAERLRVLLGERATSVGALLANTTE